MNTDFKTPAEIKMDLQAVLTIFERGCGDSLCALQKPKGMQTNGGCQCSPRSIAEKLMEIAVSLEAHGRHWKYRYSNVSA